VSVEDTSSGSGGARRPTWQPELALSPEVGPFGAPVLHLMLKAKQLSATLARAVSDGVTNVMLINEEGAMIAAAHSGEVDQTISAVLASIYNEYKAAEKCVDTRGAQGASPGSNTLRSMLFDCATARVACGSFMRENDAEDSEANIAILCVCGTKDTPYGILFNKLALVKNNLKCLEDFFSAGRTEASPPNAGGL